jgi:hypothetical protein
VSEGEGVAAPRGTRYQDQRRYVVAARLEDLEGPTRGLVRLDRSLDWSDDPSYDLDDEADLALMYQTVLREATSTAALNRWLNAGTLKRLWPALWLPPTLRSAWQSRFPDLEPPRALAG